MIRFRWYESGQIFGIRYEFDEGDSLPEHAHEPETLHNVIVLQGAIALSMRGMVRVVSAGEIVDFDGSVKHLISAAKANTVILNLFLNGIPRGYGALPIEERSGTLPS